MKLPKISLKHIDNRVKAAVITVIVIAVIILAWSLILKYPAETVVLFFLSIVIGIVAYSIWGMYRGILDIINGER